MIVPAQGLEFLVIIAVNHLQCSPLHQPTTTTTTMYTYTFDPKLSKPEFYAELKEQIRLVIEGQTNWLTNLSNSASLIHHGLNTIHKHSTLDEVVNWTGFYLTGKESDLFLGPFQGRVACSMIKFGRGVCGTAAAAGVSQVVQDVSKFPGHIACDAETKSEIVVPLLLSDGRVVGVLDIDALELGIFDEEDRAGLEDVVRVILEGCDWTYPAI